MEPRQLIGGASFPPDDLKVIYDAFDDAWVEVAGDVSTRADAIEIARLSLATIVLSLAKMRPIDRDSIKAAAVAASRLNHHVT